MIACPEFHQRSQPGGFAGVFRQNGFLVGIALVRHLHEPRGEQ